MRFGRMMWNSEIVIFYCLICFVVGSVELSAHLRYCENGQDTSFYPENFRNSVILGETFDNFCFTQDLVTMHCCLDESLDIKSSGSIVDFQIYNITSPGSAPVVWSLKRRDFGKVTADRQCVTFVVDSTAHNCKVKILYRERGANSSAPNKTAVYFSNISHPKIPYSVRYRAPSVTMLESETYAKASVIPYSVSDNFSSNWLLCTCFVPSAPAEKPQCQLNSYDQGKRELTWFTPKFKVPQTTNEICFAIAKEYLGTFGPNRTCVPWTFLSETLWQKYYSLWILLATCVAVIMLAFAVMMIWNSRICGTWKKSQNLNNKGNTSPTDDISEEEADDHQYEYINYDYFGVQSEKSEYQPLSSDSAFESGKLYSPEQGVYSALRDGIVIDYPPLNINFELNVQPSYPSNPNQVIPSVANVIPLYTESQLCKSENLDSNVDKNSTKSSEETHSSASQSNASEHFNTQNWYEMTRAIVL